MNLMLPYLFGAIPGFILSIIVFALYERQNKQLKTLLDETKRQLNSALAKMMAVDYEKLAEADIQARALAQSAWLQAQGNPVPDMGDLDMYNPDDFKVGKDAK
jgi:hypothetical protein